MFCAACKAVREHRHPDDVDAVGEDLVCVCRKNDKRALAGVVCVHAMRHRSCDCTLVALAVSPCLPPSLPPSLPRLPLSSAQASQWNEAGVDVLTERTRGERERERRKSPHRHN